MSKKIFLILIFITFLIGSFCFAPLENNSLTTFAQRELEIEYPTVPGVETPVTTKTALPEYLRYIFTFAIIIAGLLAFGSLIYGGIRYLTSAGDPTKMADARAQGTAGILGLIILLSSYLILNTINPQLILPKKPPIQPAVAGIKIYTMEVCQEDEEHPSFKIPPEGMKDLTDPDLNWGFDGKKIKSIDFLGDPGDLTVNLWSDTGFGGTKTTVDYPRGDTEPCKQSGPDFPLATYKSISLDWHFPGVYLYANSTDCGETKINPSEPIEEKIYQSSSATLPEFDNKTNSIKFIYGDENPDTGEYKAKYAVVLHEKENYMGKAILYDQDQGDTNCKNLSTNLYGGPANIGVSSITVYLKPVGDPIGEGVRFWEDKNYLGCALPSEDNFYKTGNEIKKLKDIKECGYDKKNKKCGKDKDCDDRVTSIEVDGHFVALLFEKENYDGKCEVFMSGDPDLRNNSLGQCGFLGRFDCLSSFIVKARK